LVYGPYYKGLQEGTYRADYYLKIENAKPQNAKTNPAAQLEVVEYRGDTGKEVRQVLGTSAVNENTGSQYKPFAVGFRVPAGAVGGSSISGIQFIVSVPDTDATVVVDRIEVRKQ